MLQQFSASSAGAKSPFSRRAGEKRFGR